MIGAAAALCAVTALATTLIVRPSAPAADPAVAVAVAPAAATVPAGKAAAQSAAAPKALAAAAPVAPAAAAEAQASPAAVAVCNNCGVIEAVTPFQRKGEASGVGAVAGGLIGGVLGNQVGGGSGQKAATVIGAVGGGMVGHEIEKRQRSTTWYSVKVRMEDGTLRTVTQETAPTAGQKVTIEGSRMRVQP